ADRFAIITDAEVANKIKKSLLEKKLLGNLKDATDVFSYRTRSFSTGQKTSGVRFPNKDFGETKYGVSVGDKVYFFTAKGEETKEAFTGKSNLAPTARSRLRCPQPLP